METELTKRIKAALWKHTDNQGTFGCEEVTIGWYGTERVDYMTYDVKDTFRCYEIKISKSDFRSKNHNSFIGHLNYYVFPENLYPETKEDIPDGIGVMLYSEDQDYMTLVKRPKRRAPSVDIQILKNSMIRSLDREIDHYRKILDRETILRKNREISCLQKENRNLSRRNNDLQFELHDLRHPERKLRKDLEADLEADEERR